MSDSEIRNAIVRIQRNGYTDRVNVDVGDTLDVSNADSIEIRNIDVRVEG